MLEKQLVLVLILLCCVPFHVQNCLGLEDGVTRSQFPKGFLFGACTSSYQVHVLLHLSLPSNSCWSYSKLELFPDIYQVCWSYTVAYFSFSVSEIFKVSVFIMGFFFSFFLQKKRLREHLLKMARV